MAESARDYDLAVIRRLLLAAFGAEDLKRFCQDRPALDDVLPRFGPGQGLDDMVDEVIDYCDRQLLWDELLEGVKQENPRQFARYESELYPSAALPSPRDALAGVRRQIGQPRSWLIGVPVVIGMMLALGWLLANRWVEVTPTPSATPSPTPTRTLTPVPMPSPTPGATPLPEPYDDVWHNLGGEQGPLGLPAPKAVSRRYSVQEFEGGAMLFRDNRYDPPENWIYVVYWGPGGDRMAGSSWTRYVDTWLPGDPALSCEEAAPEPLGPIAGFGRLWCQHPEVQAGLGAATQSEVNVRGGWLDFEHGVMIYDIWYKRVFVLFDNEHWRMYSD
jgi:hypothetical protein